MRTLITALAYLAAAIFPLQAAETSATGQLLSASANIETNFYLPSQPAPKNIEPAPLREWTVMVYSNGKNNLAADLYNDVMEMEKVGSTDQVNIIAELGQLLSEGGKWDGARRMYIIRDDRPKQVATSFFDPMGPNEYSDSEAIWDSLASKTLYKFTKVDMGNWEHLTRFILWSKHYFPAKKYLLIIENHGAGWTTRKIIVPPGDNGYNNLPGGIANLPIKFRSTRSISYDDQTGNFITTPELGEAIGKSGGVHVYASDACLMQMLEVAFELRNCTPFVVGSEEVIPGQGFDYTRLMDRIAAHPMADPSGVAGFVVKSFADHYGSGPEPTTLSAIREESLNSLIPVLNDFAKALMSNPAELPNIQNAMMSVQRFSEYTSGDFFHFASLIFKGSQNETVKAAAEQVMAYLGKRAIGLNYRTSNTEAYVMNAYGMAIYLPSQDYNESYGALQLSKVSLWDEFLKYYSDANKQHAPWTK